MSQEALTLLDQFPWVDFNRLDVPGTDMLVCGKKGEGKSTFLMMLAGYFLNRNETVIWRDDGRLEILSMNDQYPMRFFIPRGCKFDWNHPNAEVMEFEPNDIPATLLQKLAKNKINVLLFDLFNEDYKAFVRFWALFFERLYHWKLGHSGTISLFIDEFNDIAPAHGRGKFSGHKQLSEYIWVNFKKYRAVGMRLVASSHGYKEIHDQIRENFVFHAFKKMSLNQAPMWLGNYMFVIPKLPIDWVFVTQVQDKKMRLKVKPIVKPKAFAVTYEIGPQASLASEDVWRDMYFQLLDFCMENDKVRRKELMLIHNKKRPAIDMMIFRHREEKRIREEQMPLLTKPRESEPELETSEETG